MKVLIVGSFWQGSLEESYARAFESLGHAVARFDTDSQIRKQGSARILSRLFAIRDIPVTGQNLVSQAVLERPDLTLVIKGRALAPKVLLSLKKQLASVPLVNFNPDSPWEPRNSSRYLLESIPIYDHHFTWNRGLIPRFESSGGQGASYLPFAFDPNLHFPVDEPLSRDFDAVFVGTYDSERDKLLSTLSGCKIGIWGNGWQRAVHVPKNWVQYEAVYGEASTRVLHRAVCAINILRSQNAGSHNMRTFEIPATRHTLVTTRSSEQSEFFQEGEEMVCYCTPDELFARIRELNDRPEHAEEIALRGYKRVQGETYAARVRTLLDTLGF